MFAARRLSPPLSATAPSGTAAFIQECFDDLFDYLDRIQLFLENESVTLNDVRSPIEYYAKRMARHKAVYQHYIEVLGQPRALHFLAVSDLAI